MVLSHSSNLQVIGRMEWSPFRIRVLLSGSLSGCASHATVSGLETRDHPRIFCSQCQVICPTLVVDCSSDSQWMWCPRCQRREEITSQEAPRSVVPMWFLHGPLSTDGVSLPSLLQATVLSHGFSVHSFHSRWLPPNVSVTFLCIPRDLPSRVQRDSGIHRQLRSFVQ